MFNRNVYENSRPDGIGVLEVSGGDGHEENAPRQFIPLKRTELKGEIDGPLANCHLIQTFGYTAQQCDQVLEAFYRFPLPGDVAVVGVRARFGEVEIKAELKERQQAENDYADAKRVGRQAALVTRESPDVFTLQIAGLKPDQEITIETDYVQLARSEGAGWSLRVPLTTSPRYVRSDENDSRHAQGQPLALLRDPGHRFSLDLTFRGASQVSSHTHSLQVNPEKNELHVRLEQGEVLPDRDCVISWLPAQAENTPSLQVWRHDDVSKGHAYFLALVAPPIAPSPDLKVPREVILLVDHSGSMDGPKWEAADWAVKRFLSDLAPEDTFNLCLFHSRTFWFSDRPRLASPQEIQNAIRFLEQHRDSGGTELGIALEQALSQERTSGDYSRHVLIITDAEVSDEGRILRLADEESQKQARRRINVLCIDAAPNSFLALELAERGGGIARFLTSAPEEEDITTALDQILKDWAAPVLANLRLGVNRPVLEAASGEVKRDSATGRPFVNLGDLPSGRPVWVAGRTSPLAADALMFHVESANNGEIPFKSDASSSNNTCPALKPLFGARRILGLEFLMNSRRNQDQIADYLIRLGYDPEKVLAAPGTPPRLYSENAQRDVYAALRQWLVREALDYGLMSSETAFVATRTETGKKVEGGVLVANALPSGWSPRFLTGAAPAIGVRSQSASLSGALPIAPASAPSMTLFKHIGKHEAKTPSEASALRPKEIAIFSGNPSFVNGLATLFDSSRKENENTLPDQLMISGVKLRFLKEMEPEKLISPELTLLIFVEDLASPRAQVRLIDLVRGGLKRPLNLLRESGQIVRVVLADPRGAWVKQAPKLEIKFEVFG